ncbi:MAG TPA: hypothetical protein VJT71_06305 [Pyrinomonadaceae bacterium]|nr:hypothetical protein [Pyrinomonadaceae bacterium]
MINLAGRFTCIILALSLACASTIAQTVTTQSVTTRPVLELGVELLSQRYCAASDASTSLAMDLRLRYTNRTNQKVILYKGHDLFYQTRIRRPAQGTRAAYDLLHINSRYWDEEFEPIDRPSPGRVFVTLAPGQSYERLMTIGVSIVGDEAVRGDNAIRAGEHTLQMTVSTWYKTWPLGQKLRAQWQTKGHLWLEPVVSTPIRFVAERPQSIPACR